MSTTGWSVAFRLSQPLDARSTYVKKPRVLILSSDIIVAALLGALISVEGGEPAFPGDREPARDALLRLRPVAVLVEGDSRDPADEVALGAAMMIGATIIFYGPARAFTRMSELALRFETRVLALPPAQGDIAALLEGEPRYGQHR